MSTRNPIRLSTIPAPSDADLARAAEKTATTLEGQAQGHHDQARAAETLASLHTLAARVLDAAAAHENVVAVTVLDWAEEDADGDTVDVDVLEALDADGNTVAEVGGTEGAVPLSGLSDLDPFIDPEATGTALGVGLVRAWVVEQSSGGVAADG